ncbi:MAG: hypothetical protein KDI81_08205, partial [Xanthomonadales bacterium]|nr:hypothetical protein [Xanthomonadales bacterium]
HFSGLDPGGYELVVEGRDFAGTASPPRTLKIFIAAFWWQEPLVRAVLAGLLVLLAAALVLAY